VQGALDLHSGDGDVRVASASGPLQLSSANGDVTGTGLTSSQVQASSKNGTVDLNFTGVPKTVTGRSDNGNVIVGLPRGPTGSRGVGVGVIRLEPSYLVSATSDNGSHSVGVPTNSTSDRHIVVSSSNGDVSVEYAP
jgi:DUF4097 and DUF4098 domain-containing protein YvlB